MERLACELDRLDAELQSVESMLCDLVVDGRSDASHVEDLQKFDAMLQTLAALAEFAHEVAKESENAPPLPVKRMTASMLLGDLRLRLSGSRGTEAVSSWANSWEAHQD